VKYSIYFVTNRTSFHFEKVVIWCEEESSETTKWRPITNRSYNIDQDDSKMQVFKVRENQKWFHQKYASCLEVAMNLLLYNFLMYIIKFLLTEREVYIEKYQTQVFFVQTEPGGWGLYKKTVIRYFSAHTEQARLLKSFLYGIYWHLYLKKTQERPDLKCRLVAWYTFGRRNKKIPMQFLFFLTKNHSQISYFNIIKIISFADIKL
jgi:hypothetical protein